MEELRVYGTWRQLLHTARRGCYYQRLSQKLNRWNRAGLTLTLTLAIGASLTLPVENAFGETAPIFTVFGIGAGGLAVLAAVWFSYQDFARKAAFSAGVAAQYTELATQWAALWTGRNENDARIRYDMLEARTLMVDSCTNYLDLEENPDLNTECEEAMGRYWTSALSPNRSVEAAKD